MVYSEICIILVVFAAEVATSSGFALPASYPSAATRCIQRRVSNLREFHDLTGGRRAAFGVRPSRTHHLFVRRSVDHGYELKAPIKFRNDTSTSFLSPLSSSWPPSVNAKQSHDHPASVNLLDGLAPANTMLQSHYNENDQQSALGSQQQIAAIAATALTALAAVATWWLATHSASLGDASAYGVNLASISAWVQQLVSNPQETLQSVVNSVNDMGNMGLVYFGLIYLVAEILAVPATPLTLSAGCLFGVARGAAVVLLSASIAASVAFWIGKTVLRSWVEEKLQENPKFAKLDQAIGEQGFQLLLLVRLSPIFPFAISNYLYGASSISFWPYFFGTLLGFAPGTLAYVYTGMVGKALTLGGGDGATQPWYVYAGGLAVLAGLLSLVSQVASNIIESLEDGDGTGPSTTSTSTTKR